MTFEIEGNFVFTILTTFFYASGYANLRRRICFILA